MCAGRATSKVDGMSTPRRISSSGRTAVVLLLLGLLASAPPALASRKPTTSEAAAIRKAATRSLVMDNAYTHAYDEATIAITKIRISTVRRKGDRSRYASATGSWAVKNNPATVVAWRMLLSWNRPPAGRTWFEMYTGPPDMCPAASVVTSILRDLGYKSCR